MILFPQNRKSAAIGGVQTLGSGTLRKALMDFIFFLQLFEVDRMPKKNILEIHPISRGALKSRIFNVHGPLKNTDIQSALNTDV